ncbi:MAG: VOC family protein [Pseudolysinimonas sp.]|uniref:VOC family protein n=1 Tax=Pseudolysinimonas sp. TaxID=2680009 RepID=UPI003266B0CE
MTISISHFPVSAPDVDASVAFYRDALGFTVVMDVPNGSYRWVTMASPDDPNAQIVLSEPHAGRSQQEGDEMLALVAKGAFGPIVLRTDDVDAAFERARSSGTGEVLQEPMDQGWGVKDCAFRDPAGNMIRIAQPA